MIAKTAIIEAGAQLGEGVVVEDFAFISKDAVIGDRCVIKQGARVLGDTHIGEDSKIYSYAILGDIPQDVSFKSGDFSALRIGKRASIREFATINSGSNKGDGHTRIGDDAFIMAYCHVAHDCRLGNSVILANNATLAGHVEIGDFSVVGGLTPIHQFVKVGEGCMIAGASALSQDVPPFCLAEGNRAYVRGLNLVGLRRRFDREQIDSLLGAYRFLFKQGILKEQASELLNLTDDINVKKMCEFILNTTRGIPLKGRDNG
ncbi:acyl-ACP--UDP-N-acetylglucosamine O-acyltransferase [Campylobacter sp. 19-13652]|uniref:acyl-ACP--UDP-N-acetylglucosamine O-acyltransferase n=1 Tax=Campylobacter sp. 19-13652 TaxID=2840180 RepID=UPI001C793ADD|nr:acyl-ACP--UDP-N-acetylglucosamine O-acyltransferase [Campylobacter sp. 19-13652]BCX78693.1 acyl-[acyl-carrier-protein]--UDP-N-acetylglucosamine O-acyltransferase [Campylobacter sp. 19-13652]